MRNWWTAGLENIFKDAEDRIRKTATEIDDDTERRRALSTIVNSLQGVSCSDLSSYVR